MRDFIRARIAAGDTEDRRSRTTLVDQFGESVLAAPPKSGFNLLAWVLPLAGVVLAAGGRRRRSRTAGAGAARREPSRARPPNGRFSLDPELERRLDEELARFDG